MALSAQRSAQKGLGNHIITGFAAGRRYNRKTNADSVATKDLLHSLAALPALRHFDYNTHVDLSKKFTLKTFFKGVEATPPPPLLPPLPSMA
jgi:hypothetical protein